MSKPETSARAAGGDAKRILDAQAIAIVRILSVTRVCIRNIIIRYIYYITEEYKLTYTHLVDQIYGTIVFVFFF